MMINLIVTLSNLYGLVPIYYSTGYYRLWISVIVSASVLMHLSETKHQLPGIYPFNQFSKQFLWFDRIMAYTPVIYVGYMYIVNNVNLFEHLFNPIFIIGSICLLLSEGIKGNKYFFATTHSIWHVCAYHTIAMSILRF
jgi:hypothetical protein